MKINDINSVFALILTSYEAGVTSISTARMVKYTATDKLVAFSDYHIPDDEVLAEVYSLALEVRNGLNEDAYRFFKRVLASLEDLDQNQ